MRLLYTITCRRVMGQLAFVADNSDTWGKVAQRAAATILSEYTPESTTDDLIEAYRAAIA